MKGVKVALCDVECVNLLTNAIKILGIYFSYIKKLENEKNFFRSYNESSKSYKYIENAKSVSSWENSSL